MLSTWIEASVRGRLGGPVRAGMWSAVVVGTNPIESDQLVWLEMHADEEHLGLLPAYWVENRGSNSLWHVPIPPQGVNVRLKYRAMACRGGSDPVYSPYQEAVVRANIPSKTDPPMGAMYGPEGLLGNRMMTVRVDERGSTYDVFYPTVGLHSDVRPANGDRYQSRAHFRAIVGGVAIGSRIDWFSERLSWESSQRYQGATNLLVTELKSRRSPVRVMISDFVAMGETLPCTGGGSIAPGQYFKRYRLVNESNVPLETTFGLYVQAEVNGGVGELGLLWQDVEQTLLATNRGHGHANRKLARDSTVEFAISLAGGGQVICEAAGSNEAMLLQRITIRPQDAVTLDVLISGAFTGWRGDIGTYEHWIRPALAWFRASDLDLIEQGTAQQWDDFVEVLPTLRFPRPAYGAVLRRSALAIALHCDAEWGAVASGFDRGIEAYCWPRDAVLVGDVLGQIGHEDLAKRVYQWLSRLRGHERPYAYWFQKYTIDGWPEWETPSIDQTAVIPWGLERLYRRTGNLEFVELCWPLVERAAAVCAGRSGHPGLHFLTDANLVYSAGVWDTRFGAFLYSNASVVAGLRSAARLALALGHAESAEQWMALADQVWELGILSEARPGGGGMVDPASGRFLESRYQSLRSGLWGHYDEAQLEANAGIDISLLGPIVPFELLPASDPRLRASAEAILRQNTVGPGGGALTRWSPDPQSHYARLTPSDTLRHEPSTLATLWMARYLIRLGQEIGDPAAWTRAVALLDNIRNRLGPLGQSIRFDHQTHDDPTCRQYRIPGAWPLHGMLIATLLDLAGFEYDATEQRLTVTPILPPEWPRIGFSRELPCGQLSYFLERPAAGPSYRLSLKGRIRHPLTVEFRICCPGLAKLVHWQASPNAPRPEFNPARGYLSWSVELEGRDLDAEWSWSGPTR